MEHTSRDALVGRCVRGLRASEETLTNYHILGIRSAGPMRNTLWHPSIRTPDSENSSSCPTPDLLFWQHAPLWQGTGITEGTDIMAFARKAEKTCRARGAGAPSARSRRQPEQSHSPASVKAPAF